VSDLCPADHGGWRRLSAAISEAIIDGRQGTFRQQHMTGVEWGEPAPFTPQARQEATEAALTVFDDVEPVTPRVSIGRKRVGGRTWYWQCDGCGWLGKGLPSQPSALREACRHLNEGCPHAG